MPLLKINWRRLVRLQRVILAAVILFPATAHALELEPRHRPDSPLPVIEYSAELSYSDYVEQARDIILNRHPHADKILPGTNGLKVVDLIAPKQWPRASTCGTPKKGILLIHGLSDSPYTVGDVGDDLNRDCALVRSVLLPGHSTVPGDLVAVTDQDWINASNWAIQSFAGEVEELVILGYSTGATLALEYVIRNQSKTAASRSLALGGSHDKAATQTTKITGLILLSSAIAINTSVSFMAGWVDCLGSIFNERWRWASIDKDLDFAKYESFPMNAAAQIHNLIKRMGERDDKANPVSVPVLMISSKQDTTINAIKTIEFFENRTTSNSKMLLYNSDITKITDTRIEVRDSTNHAKNILSLGHTSMSMKPSNAHYGENGDYVSCLHYGSGSEQESCLDRSNTDIRYGEVTEENKAKGTLRRISWNHDYDYALDRMNQFLESL
ncbi:MAG: alpha/beta hydrolase [Pseudomonadales bacterium]|nr:alpha/beta hydrolase [Pseudomonadales bacterium]